MADILLIDDDPSVLELLANYLAAENHHIETCLSGEAGLDTLSLFTFDLVITDLKLPGIDGLAFIEEAKRRGYEGEVIVITGYGEVDTAIKAMKLGAYDYLTKPLYLDLFRLVVARALERHDLKQTVTLLQASTIRTAFGALVGGSASMQALYRTIEKVAPITSTILISGETGTGKELVARAIHQHSPRHQNPFIAINCGSLPESLLESELFGYRKGAFTGASSTQIGLFEASQGGTIFLDEVGTATPSTQIALLRVLQNKTIRRIGETEDRPVDIRVIASCNLDIEEEVSQGRFREDIYYRLSAVHIALPPLRERIGDIPLLTTHFLKVYSRKFHKSLRQLSPKALEVLLDYTWPGNVRELEHVIEQAVILSPRTTIYSNDLGSLTRESKEQSLTTLQDVEKQYIIQVLTATSWNKTKAAQILGIPRTSLIRKMKLLNLKP